ncbi:Heparinase II/III-like protein [Planctomycetes bacterium CA13]|uniref:Heparinase II/III-like protein n=1 Tax=Novipirellula herctigrandis TaxID=2527986 RepID=A0A5C5YUZ3_9BACT|nr:Heparinase II/III-like protein [Planctomycetes bacterium CA13]
MLRISRLVIVPCFLLIGTAFSQSAIKAETRTPVTPDTQRLSQIAEMLPKAPIGLGRPIRDRDAWQSLRETSDANEAIQSAETLLDTPMPELTDEIYLDFSKTGNRTRCQRVLSLRHSRLSKFTMAECLENRGRFLEALEQSIRDICSEKTWVLPAHDRELKNFRGNEVNIDLAVAGLSWELATTYYWLGDQLNPEIRQLIRNELNRRTFVPFMRYVKTGEPKMWWVTGTNNWNAVCLAGTVGAALAVIEDPKERAFFVAAAEKSIPYFLSGFTPDGYCSEGMGYWNYGFGHFVYLSETLRQATDGEIDWLRLPNVRNIATFGQRIEIGGGVYPAFADCSVKAHPGSSLMAYLSRVYQMGMSDVEQHGLGHSAGLRGSLVSAGVYVFPNAANRVAPAQSSALSIRDYFKDAEIYIARPAQNSKCRAAVALKGGHNAEHHNHNDVGSYVFVVGDQPVLVDPGGEVYTARTFSGKRYDSKVLNSYGHSVPRVAGQLQKTGRNAAAKILRTEFSDEKDELEIDLKAAYAVPDLKSLKRTFIYWRSKEGTLQVKDEVEFSSPQTFETALVTLGRWTQDGDTLSIYELDEAVQVRLKASAEFEVVGEEISEDVHTHSLPKRIAIRFKRPVTKATMTVTCVPLSQSNNGVILRNGDFTHQDWCWTIPEDGMGTISQKRSFRGSDSLSIADASNERGSNILSAPVAIDELGEYELRGKVLGVSGDGIGLYVRFLDKERKMLNIATQSGNLPSIGTVGGSTNQWDSFAFPFQTPKETAFLQVWIHSYNGAQVEAYLDDLAIERK